MWQVISWTVALGAVLWATAAVVADEPPHPQLPKNWRFSIPAGDAAAGKRAFVKLECYSCHRVPGADLPPARSGGGTGPDLVPAYSRLPREFLAECIINRHKYISSRLEKHTGLDRTSSKMKDYSGIVTVRQLIDIVAFLKNLSRP